MSRRDRIHPLYLFGVAALSLLIARGVWGGEGLDNEGGGPPFAQKSGAAFFMVFAAVLLILGFRGLAHRK